jgi:hypothetical protein
VAADPTVADQLNAYLPDIGDKLTDTIRFPSPFMNWVRKAAKKREFDGDLREELLDTQRSVLLHAIREGNERLGFRSPQRTKKIAWRGHRTVATLAVFNRDLAIAQGSTKNKVLDLYDDLPAKGALDPYLNLEKYMLTGNVLNADVGPAEMYGGWMCLWGGFTSGYISGLENGMLEAVAPAAQTQTTLGLAKSQTLGHYNQYTDIASLSAEGKRLVSKIISDCVYNDPEQKEPEALWVDRDSYVLYGELRTNKLMVVDSSKKDTGEYDEDFQPINGHKTKMYYTRAMLPSVDFAGTPAEKGMGYLLHGEDIELSILQDLKVTQWKPLDGTDMTIMQMPWHMRLALLRHRRNGVITGFHNA